MTPTNQPATPNAVEPIEMDWQQVILNGGPPCFFVEGRRFCGRAERWAGHGEALFHDYVSLRSLLESQFPLCPVHRDLDSRDALTLTIAENNCVACSLHEREELIDLLDKGTPTEGRKDSVSALRNLIDSYEANQAELQRLRELVNTAAEWIETSLEQDDLAMDGRQVLAQLTSK